MKKEITDLELENLLKIEFERYDQELQKKLDKVPNELVTECCP